MKSEPSSSNLDTIDSLSVKLQTNTDMLTKVPALSNPEIDSPLIKKKKPVDTDNPSKATSKKQATTKKAKQKEKQNDDIDQNIESIFTSLEHVTLIGETIEERLYEALKKYYNYDRFKSETQKNAVIAIAKRESDAYVSMPTGN